MNGDFFQAILLAALKALIKQYPGLALAAILAEIQNLGEDVAKAVTEWWKQAQDSEHHWPGPRLEYDEFGTPTGWYFDAEGNRKHYEQGIG